jgi:peptidoglycan/LPS O-acetylase OafA/YrhL
MHRARVASIETNGGKVEVTTALESPVDEPGSGVNVEAGTAPGDRRFRPDIQGLRAVAVALVVLYHAGFSGLSGGYVGVDVFFVISGFVITGLLLRERATSGSTSLLGFYGRRSRRIIPAATLVIVATVLMAYARLGIVFGNATAGDARWTALFLANFHFASIGTNYLTAQRPPSPLLNFWSLAVEEQFYLVYPTIFLLIAALRTRWSLRAKLAIGLVVIIVASFVLSVTQTASDPTGAYFSPLTRAWELGIGALVAVGTDRLLTLRKSLGAALTWVGVAAIVYGAVAFNGHTPYPGSWVAVPVVGTALVIAGGATVPPGGAEWLLKRGPFQWVGKLSYSIYLWHWPLLVVAAEAADKSALPFRQNLVWIAVALVAAAASFRLVENQIRHAAFRRHPRWGPVGLGLALMALSVGVASVELGVHNQPAPVGAAAHGRGTVSGEAAEADIRALVRDSGHIRSLPANLVPPLGGASLDWGGPPPPCFPGMGQTSIPACVFGDRTAGRTMVVYGDSHAAMWFQALNSIAFHTHWKLVYLDKGDCPADSLPYGNPTGFGRGGGIFAPCIAWHTFAIKRIRRLHPDLVVLTQEIRSKPDGASYSAQQWQEGLEKTFLQLGVPGNRIVVLGNIPILPKSPPECLSLHPDDVQACSGVPPLFEDESNRGEEAAAAQFGARYINITSWFCAKRCSPVIGKYQVYFDEYHVTGTYSRHLEGVLADALHLSANPKEDTTPPTTSVEIPSRDASVSGTHVVLDAGASADFGVTKVQFRLTGGTLHNALIGTGHPEFFGWLAEWNSATVPNGTYTIVSFAYDSAGKKGVSAPISVTVKN